LTGASTGDKDKTKNQIEIVERWLRDHHIIRKNKYTRITEVDGKPLTDGILNQLWLDIARVHTKIPFITVARIIESDFVEIYDPFQEWFDEYKSTYPEERCVGFIKRLFDTITPETDDDTDDDQDLFSLDANYIHDFGRKWIIGLIGAMHGQVVPIMLVLTGLKQNTGKTEWFRRLLPPELSYYYAESKLDSGKDAEILMSKKLIIMDDEMGGKSKMEAKRLKELTSADTFTLREPYGRVTVELKRLAVLAGTSNDHEIITDQTGNRRIIPISVGSIDHAKYNAIDKRAVLMEAYYAFCRGEDFHLKQRDIDRMLIPTGKYEIMHLEREMLYMYFRKPNKGETPEMLTNTEMKIMMENTTHQRINQTKLGMELKKGKFRRHKVLENGTQKWVYDVVKKNKLV
jgi:predicted P-loop ATPase